MTSEPAYEGDPQYSKDGKKIVFVREQNGIGHIWIMDVDGTNQRQLTNGLEYDESPALSPDGSKVVFSRSVNDPKFRPGTGVASEIFVMSVDGSGQRRLTDNERSDGGASFSPNGKGIIYSYSSESEYIAYMGIQGSDIRRIGAGSSPAFSPDGQRIVYVSGEYGREISIMKFDGSGRKAIHRSSLYHAYPSFTPDGSHVLFIEEPEGRGTGIINTLDLETSKVEQLSKTD